MIPPKETTAETTISKAQEVPKEISKELPTELPRGKWTGTRTPNNNNPNAAAADVTFELNQFPDPHGRWRIGTGVFVIATMIVNPRTKLTLTDFRLEGENLTYLIPQQQAQANELQCTLTRQKDGSFAGLCPRTRDKIAGFKVTMVPPKEPAKE
jgi:hypothetical protein